MGRFFFQGSFGLARRGLMLGYSWLSFPAQAALIKFAKFLFSVASRFHKMVELFLFDTGVHVASMSRGFAECGRKPL